MKGKERQTYLTVHENNHIKTKVEQSMKMFIITFPFHP